MSFLYRFISGKNTFGIIETSKILLFTHHLNFILDSKKHPIQSRYSFQKLFEDETQFRRTSVKKTIYVEIKQISNAGGELEKSIFSIYISFLKTKPMYCAKQ